VVLNEKGSQEDHTLKSLKLQVEETNVGWVINLHGIVYVAFLKCTHVFMKTKLGQSNRVRGNPKMKQ
jgi:hypothetical protein